MTETGVKIIGSKVKSNFILTNNPFLLKIILSFNLNLFCSLHNSLSDEKNLREQFNATIQTYEDKLRQYELTNRQLDQDNQELNSKLNNVVRERDEKARQLHEATTSKYLAEQKADK